MLLAGALMAQGPEACRRMDRLPSSAPRLPLPLLLGLMGGRARVEPPLVGGVEAWLVARGGHARRRSCSSLAVGRLAGSLCPGGGVGEGGG